MDMFHLLRHECCVGCAAAAVAALSPVVTGLTAIARVFQLSTRIDLFRLYVPSTLQRA
jgi:hypothetical protein